MKRVGIILDGLSSLKVFGPLIVEARHFQLVPVLFVPRAIDAARAYDHPSLQRLQQAFPDLSTQQIVQFDPDMFIQAAGAAHIQAALFVNPYNKHSHHIRALAKEHIPTFALDYFLNSLYGAAWRGRQQQVISCVSSLTERFVTSTFLRDLELRVCPGLGKYAAKYVVTGTPVSDVFSYIKASEQDIVPLPPGKKILCVMAPNIRPIHSYYVYGLTTRLRLARVLRALREVCVKRNLLLVVKSREKQWDSPLYAKYADYVLDDVPEAVFPHTSALLLKRTELLVHFGSMGVLEAAMAGVPSLGIEVEAIDKLHHYMEPAARQIVKEALFSADSGTLFHFPGVAQSISIRSSIDKLQKICHSMIESTKHTHDYVSYCSTYLGKSEKSSTERILSRVSEYMRPAGQHKLTAQLAVPAKVERP